MMYYEKGRFSLGAVSFLLPDQVYIDPEYEAEVQNGFELLDLEKRYRITIEGEYSEEDSATFLGETLLEASFHKLGPVEPIQYNGVCGHALCYNSGRHSYYEARFDLSEVEGINCLVVLVKWLKGELEHESILRERIVRELLGSLNLV